MNKSEELYYMVVYTIKGTYRYKYFTLSQLDRILERISLWTSGQYKYRVRKIKPKPGEYGYPQSSFTPGPEKWFAEQADKIRYHHYKIME